MPHTSRIKTPLKQHLHRFRLSVLPGIWFVCCVIVTLHLWQRVARIGSVVGEVAAEQISLPAGISGLLVGSSIPKLYDQVHKGDVVAMLDDSQVKAGLGVLQAEVTKLGADLEAERVKMERDQLTRLAAHQRERVRLAWEVERRHIEALQVGAQLKTLEQELQGADTVLKTLHNLADSAIRVVNVTPTDLAEQETARATLQTRAETTKRVFDEAYRQYQEAKSQSEAFPESLDAPEIEAVLAPIRAAIVVQERKMEELKLELQHLVVTSPIDGVVTEVFKVPGQQVMAGDPIVSVARPDSRFVISYVRERQNILLQEGMEVGLRLRGEPGGPEYRSTVKAVGPHVTNVPQHQLFDKSTQEWATPIQIEIPQELLAQNLRPGQLVQVIFHDPQH